MGEGPGTERSVCAETRGGQEIEEQSNRFSNHHLRHRAPLNRSIEVKHWEGEFVVAGVLALFVRMVSALVLLCCGLLSYYFFRLPPCLAPVCGFQRKGKGSEKGERKRHGGESRRSQVGDNRECEVLQTNGRSNQT